MKKIIMRVVHAALQIIPMPLKNKLKKSELLTKVYVKSLREAGFFFDAPTIAQTNKLYAQWLALKANAVEEKNSKAGSWQIVIFSFNDSPIDKPAFIGEGDIAHFFSVNAVGEKSFMELVDGLDPNLPVLLLNEGDTITASAKTVFLNALRKNDVVYCDTDALDENGVPTTPRFLPDWNPDLLYTTAYIRSGVLLMPDLLKRIGINDMSSIPGIMATISFVFKSARVGHISYPLVHLGKQPNSIKHKLIDVANCITQHTAAVPYYNQFKSLNQIKWDNSSPLVSLLVPTKNGKSLVKACIESILEKTTYTNYEIILIDNGSDEQESLSYFEYLNTLDRVKVIKYPKPFNYSAINNFGVKHAQGSIIGLINNDIEVISPDWLTYMVGYAERDSIGCVGAKLLYSDTRIQHAGVVLGYGGGAGHAHKNFPRSHSGYLNRINATSNYSAVTAACLIVKRSIFERVGGLNEKDLAVAFNDVDFCLKVRELGLQNVYCAEAELFHHESVSRGLDASPEKAARFNRELSYLQETWKKYIEYDPAYSPNLTLKRENFSIKSKEEF